SSNGAARIGEGQGSMRSTKFQGTAGYVTRMSGGVRGRGREASSYLDYQNSWLLAYQQLPFDTTSFPGQIGFDRQLHFLSPVTVEGRITRLVYFAPPGKTRLEVQRNYEQALASAGFKTVFRCTPQDRGCDSEHNGLESRYETMKQADFASSRSRQPAGSALGDQMRGLGGPNMVGTEDAYLTYGTLPGNAGPVHVMLHTAKVYQTDFTATY
ncbi:MAG: hypothetical protein P4L88_19085, partial [Rhodoferax sp.]|nr:hypothetical protein [Rhodoferax sp.]